MVDVIEVSPHEETSTQRNSRRPSAEGLANISTSPSEQLKMPVGIETVRKIDLLAIVKLQTPPLSPAIQQRNGATAEADYAPGASWRSK
jgi:hypothetical protein